jgi:GH18 family chitinase
MDDSKTSGSDGNYMTKQNLWMLHETSTMLDELVPEGELLPDWVESKINTAATHLKDVAAWAVSEAKLSIKTAGYGRGYGQVLRGDPRWMDAKYPGTDSKGNPFKKGEKVLYWPSTKTFMTGKDAQDAWRNFQSEKGDEEGNPYARSASRVAAKYINTRFRPYSPPR